MTACLKLLEFQLERLHLSIYLVFDVSIPVNVSLFENLAEYFVLAAKRSYRVLLAAAPI